MSKSTKEPEEKQFSLKDIERNMLSNINARHNAELVDFLTFIALERLAIDVTPNTQFRVDEDGKLYVIEMPGEPQPTNPDGTPIPAPDNEVATA